MVDSHIQTFSSSVLCEIYFITLFMAQQRMGVKLDVATLFIIRKVKSLQFLLERKTAIIITEHNLHFHTFKVFNFSGK